jgi:transcriptional regulator with XRE-family HTH domain
MKLMNKHVSREGGPHPVDVHVGRRIRMRRAELGISQTTLSGELGISFQQVQKYECGANRVSASMLYDIARALETDITYFFDGLPETERVSAPPTTLTRRHQSFLWSLEGHKMMEEMSRLPKSLRVRLISLTVAIRHSCHNDSEEVGEE